MPASDQRSVHSTLSPQDGVRNLLANCAQARPGERLLIAYEPEDHGYFDADVRNFVATGATEHGLAITLVNVGFEFSRTDLPDSLAHQIADFDIVVFLSRLGDQLRFSDLPIGPRYVVCFALNGHLLGSAFGSADYRAFCQIKDAVDRYIFAATDVVLTCPAGTNVTGCVPEGAAKPSDTTSLRFPLSVFSPVPAAQFSGRVALGQFLTGTGSRYYSGYTVEFENPVFAMLENGRLAGFDGSQDDVAKANAHYDRVAELFQIDRNFVHSWHAGIHPGCGFPWDIRQNYERWGGSAFGNPRVLHFHTCGAYAPGEISWNVFDPTIEISGERIWDAGHFHLERLPSGQEILNDFQDVADVFAAPDRNVGLGD